MPNIDELLGADDNSASQQQSEKSKNPTKQRLQSLKEMLDSDPVQLNTDNMLLDPNLMPPSQNIKAVDYYQEEKPKHLEYAQRVITNIVKTYIKSPKLLESPRLIDLVNKQTDKYARLLLLIETSERNFITLQEAIDSGDMSTEVFDTNMRAQQTLVNHETSCDKHLDACEKYWAAYAEQYGMENEETKIVQETEVKTDEKNRMIMNATDIIERIRGVNQEKNIAEDKIREKKKREKEKKEDEESLKKKTD